MGLSLLDYVAYWINRTGLLPPQCRLFSPRLDGDERTCLSVREHAELKREANERLSIASNTKKTDPDDFPPKRIWPHKDYSWRFNNDPGFDNVVRAYEDDLCILEKESS
jgi:hypothetical protein